MKVKIFNNTTGLEQGEFVILAGDVDNFDASEHSGSNSTAVVSSEDAYEVLIDGTTYVLDLSNIPTVPEGSDARLTGYEAKDGGGYQGTWETVVLPTSSVVTE